MKSSSENPNFTENWTYHLWHLTCRSHLSAVDLICDFDIKTVNVALVPCVFQTTVFILFQRFAEIHNCQSMKTICVQKQP